MYRGKYVLHIQDFKDLFREQAKLVKKNFWSESFLKKNIKYQKVQAINKVEEDHEGNLQTRSFSKTVISE